ncbi:RICIN domain-containing protein [Dactylosporangium sp. AC04546]|uniref:RICIN domain-containing protein n=1 Tax=Dactylosporangium sp. AC04546 TaxID=2862460 RepID=UPI001EDFE3B1|nr:RICIN domain-containing protein [Dactylosporangium sp. AC04546]WVK79680.1 RICIN domain-containing protein [Dactylosporangium sp. AC04546]
MPKAATVVPADVHRMPWPASSGKDAVKVISGGRRADLRSAATHAGRHIHEKVAMRTRYLAVLLSAALTVLLAASPASAADGSDGEPLPPDELAALEDALQIPTGQVQLGTLEERAVPVHLKNKKSGKCVDVPGWSTASGTRLDQWTCVDQNNQKFRFRLVAMLPAPLSIPIYQIYNVHSGMCITAGGKDNGSAVKQAPCGPGNTWTQTWMTYRASDDYYVYINYGYSKKCMDVPGYSTSNGTRLDLWDCGSYRKGNQLFKAY